MGNLKEFVENCVENYRSAGESSTKGQTEVILEKFAQHLDEEGVGGADWNTLQNKPFGEVREFDDIVWDGVTTGRDNFSSSGATFCKISSDVTDLNQLVGHEATYSDGTKYGFDSANFISGTGGALNASEPMVIAVSALEFEVPMLGAGTAPSTGLYIASSKDAFTINGTIVKKLDNQFIDSQIMIVDVAGQGSNLSSSASSDEIVSAVNSGKIVFARLSDNMVMTFTGSPGTYECCFGTSHMGDGSLYVKKLVIYNNKTCVLNTYTLSATEVTT